MPETAPLPDPSVPTCSGLLEAPPPGGVPGHNEITSPAAPRARAPRASVSAAPAATLPASRARRSTVIFLSFSMTRRIERAKGHDPEMGSCRTQEKKPKKTHRDHHPGRDATKIRA